MNSPDYLEYLNNLLESRYQNAIIAYTETPQLSIYTDNNYEYNKLNNIHLNCIPINNNLYKKDNFKYSVIEINKHVYKYIIMNFLKQYIYVYSYIPFEDNLKITPIYTTTIYIRILYYELIFILSNKFYLKKTLVNENIVKNENMNNESINKLGYKLKENKLKYLNIDDLSNKCYLENINKDKMMHNKRQINDGYTNVCKKIKLSICDKILTPISRTIIKNDLRCEINQG